MTPPPSAIILFDGLCAFCDGSVRLLMKLDRRQRLRFAPLQSEAGQHLLERFEVPPETDSIVVIPLAGPLAGRLGDLANNQGPQHALTESDAAIAIARLLGFPWSLAAVFKIIPRPLRDGLYRFIARHRYRLVGRLEACRVPTPRQRAVVLETVGEVGQVEGTQARRHAGLRSDTET